MDSFTEKYLGIISQMNTKAISKAITQPMMPKSNVKFRNRRRIWHIIRIKRTCPICVRTWEGNGVHLLFLLH